MRSCTLDLPAGTLDCAWWGPPPGERPTLVLLHEGLGCIALWRDVPAQLAAATGYGVFAYSRFGYGASSPCALPRPLDYMRREATEILPAVLDAAGITRAILIGHSDGASIAAIHAGAVHDPRIAGVVLIAPHYFVEPSGLRAIEAARIAYETGDLRARLARYHTHVDAAFRGWCDAWLDPGFGSFNLTADLAAITVPALQLQGTADPYGTTAQTDCLAKAETVLLPVRHAPHLEAPEASMAAIVGFTQKVLGEKSPISNY